MVEIALNVSLIVGLTASSGISLTLLLIALGRIE